MTGWIHAELTTDTVAARTTTNAQEIDAVKHAADRWFEDRLGRLVAQAGGRSLSRAYPQEVLRESDTRVFRATAPDCASAVGLARAAFEELPWIRPPGDGPYGSVPVRPTLKIAVMLADNVPDVAAARTRDILGPAICDVAGADQILITEDVFAGIEADANLAQKCVPLGALRLPDLGPPRTLHRVRTEQVHGAEAPRSLDSIPHNLPIHRTPFIGRTVERREIRLLMLAHRLLSIVGTGGVGKTRLAVQIAADSFKRYDDGIWVVDLATLSNPELVGEAIAATIGVEESTSRSSVDTVVDRLKTATALIVLDNCEHVLGRCRDVAVRIVDACPDVRVLVTSRRALDVPSEYVYELDALSVSVSAKGADGSERATERADAVNLFLSLVQQADENRESDREVPNSSSVARDDPTIPRLCRLLEGNPLAIELAAARAHSWTVGEIFRKVSDHYEALGEDPSAAHPRHRSLWATFDWSYRLLSSDAQRLFRRISVFRGGATADAIRAVVTDDDVQQHDLDGTIRSLVVNHLLIQEDDRGTDTRYRLLETIRAFAAQLLQAHEGIAGFEERHAAHYRRTSIREAPSLNGPRQQAVQQRFRAEHSNIHAALDWHIRNRNVEDGLRFASALRRFWVTAGYLNEGRHYLQRLVELRDGIDADATLAQAHYCLATIARRQSDFDAAKEHLEYSLRSAMETRDAAMAGKCHNELGSIAWRHGDISKARTHYREALGMLQETEHEVGIATVLNSLAVTDLFAGEFETAREHLEESLAVVREIGNQRGAIDVLNNLAIVDGVLGNYGRARSQLAEAMNMLQHLQDDRRSALSLNNLADIAMRQGRTQDARELVEHALTLLTRLTDYGGMILSRIVLGNLALRTDDLDRAEQEFHRARQLVDAYDERSSESEVLMGLGQLELHRGQLDDAERCFREALANAERMPHHLAIASAVHGLAEVALKRGDLGEASQHAEKALTLRDRMGNRRGVAQTLELISEIAFQRNDTPRAVRLVAMAHRIREELETPRRPALAARIEKRMDEIRDVLGEATFDAAWTAGAHASIEDAVVEVTDRQRVP